MMVGKMGRKGMKKPLLCSLERGFACVGIAASRGN